MKALQPLLPLALAGLLLVPGAGCNRQPAPDGSLSADQTSAAPTSPPPGLAYIPPEPGTYRLPPIQRAADGTVMDVTGTAHRLFDYMGDRYVVLSFIYSQCVDPEGCPLARVVFHRLHDRLQNDPQLEGRVRLVTLSFDPDRDTPEAMRRVARLETGDPDGVPDRGPDQAPETWAFLTTASQAELEPILDGYGQYVVPEVDEDGRPTGLLSHVLKVYLIDREQRVRNVYSSSFLHPAVVVNDLKTLLLEDQTEEAAG